MNIRILAGVFAVAAGGFVGCATPQVEPSLADAPPPPDFSRELPLEPPADGLAARFCHLGTTCLAMDPRPFETCLLSTQNCRDKIIEPLLVDDEQGHEEEPAIQATRSR